jgi:V/A-type H+-transporting ATPase subunit K
MIILRTALIIAVLYLVGRRLSTINRARSLVGGLLTFNAVLILMAIGLAVLQWLGTPVEALAAPLVQNGGGGLSSSAAIGAGLSTGLAAIGAGIAVAGTGSAAIGAIAEKPETLGRTLIYVGLAEGIAIYGLIISFIILTS